MKTIKEQSHMWKSRWPRSQERYKKALEEKTRIKKQITTWMDNVDTLCGELFLEAKRVSASVRRTSEGLADHPERPNSGPTIERLQSALTHSFDTLKREIEKANADLRSEKSPIGGKVVGFEDRPPVQITEEDLGEMKELLHDAWIVLERANWYQEVEGVGDDLDEIQEATRRLEAAETIGNDYKT